MRKNENFRGFRVYDFAPHSKSKTKLGNIGKFSFTSIFGSIWDPRSKSQINDLRQKRTLTSLSDLIRKNENFRGFWVFHFAFYLKLKT